MPLKTLTGLARRAFGTKHERDIKKVQPIVQMILDEEARLDGIALDEIPARVDALREQVRAEERSLEDVLPEMYALTKLVCRRLMGQSFPVRGHDATWEMVPFDCQLVGAVVLHQGKITEMATGEGKTLVATMPAALNALTGRSVHIITVNDYLATRDMEWMWPVYNGLGMRVSCVTQEIPPSLRKEAYAADIVYGTNSEFGFDYLRDNMAQSTEEQVQTGQAYAIVDEVDSVLIDEARTPLIISGPVEHSGGEQYEAVAPAVERIIQKQNRQIAGILREAEKYLEEGDDWEAGTRLVQGQKGAPKNRKLLKLLENGRVQKLVRRTELDLMEKQLGGRELTPIQQLLEELYFTIDEKTNVSDLTEKGRVLIAGNDTEMFVLPDLDGEDGALDTELRELRDSDLPMEEKFEREQDIQERRRELYDRFNAANERVHAVGQLLKAHALFERDVNYIVRDNEIVIVDEFTGRQMPSRRYSDGLHQALEAKERVRVGQANQTLATVTLQNYFKRYDKLAGMTGTADTEAEEFHQIYKLDVVVIPTNQPVIRDDYSDVVYRTEREKYQAVAEEIQELHDSGRPVLVGTISVERSEMLSKMLKRRGLRHHVLNAKYFEHEAEIVAEAGMPGAITIATNMAGRGTDIKLGPGVADNGGLHILGTERHESRRIDNQLRGRAGRQGDMGSSRFYLSLEDDLMRLFASDRVMAFLSKYGFVEGEPLEHPMLTKSIATAQGRVEQQNLEIRKRLLEYDNVMNQQREAIYGERQSVLDHANLVEHVKEMTEQLVDEALAEYIPDGTHPDQWNLIGMRDWLLRTCFLAWHPEQALDMETATEDTAVDAVQDAVWDAYQAREGVFGGEFMREVERFAVLRAVDQQWKEHLYEMDMLKEGINLRAYGQRDPLVEFKREGAALFQRLRTNIRQEVVEFLFRVQPRPPDAPPLEQLLAAPAPQQQQTRHAAAPSMAETVAGAIGGNGGRRAAPAVQQTNRGPAEQQPVRVGARVGRNDPCPCGSGKKYKKCCGT